MSLQLKKSDFKNYPKTDFIKEVKGKLCILNPLTNRYVLMDGVRGISIKKALDSFFPNQPMSKSPKYIDNNIMKQIGDFASPKTKIMMKLANKNLNDVIPTPETIENTNMKYFTKALNIIGEKRVFKTEEEYKKFEDQYWLHAYHFFSFTSHDGFQISINERNAFNKSKLTFHPSYFDVYLEKDTANSFKIKIHNISNNISFSSTTKYNLYTAIENHPLLNKKHKKVLLKYTKYLFTSSTPIKFFLDKEFEKEWNDFRKESKKI